MGVIVWNHTANQQSHTPEDEQGNGMTYPPCSSLQGGTAEIIASTRYSRHCGKVVCFGRMAHSQQETEYQ